MNRLLSVLAVLFTVATHAHAADWLQFRGPGGQGVAQDKGLPVAWSADSNIDWKAELPGPGTSSPIVVGKRVFITSFSGYTLDKSDPGEISNLKRHLLCLDRATGKVLWKREFTAVQPEAKMQNFLDLHGYASSTPISDGQNVYVFLGITGVFAFDLEGKQVWQTSVGKRTHGWGTGTSPILYKDLLIVNASVESDALITLDKKTGNEVWRAKGVSQSWSSPVLVNVPGGQSELVVSGSKRILGFDPDTGKDLWYSESFNWYVCPTVTVDRGVVYALQNSACVAVKAGGRGDVTKSHTVWEKKFGAVVPSLVHHDGHLYWANDGMAYCIKASSGDVAYKERLKPNAGRLYASPLLADGKIYYVSRDNGAFVVEASPKFKLLAHNSLAPDTSIFNGSPAVNDSQLLLRSDRYLYCIGKRQ